MFSGLVETRKARLGAVCALLLGCVVASAAQDSASTSSPTSKKPATTKTAPKHRATSSSATASTAKKSSSKPHTTSSGKRRKKSSRMRGQQKIDSQRAQQIQEALIREHYLSGEATGTWNQASEDAMRKYQADHGWQSKQVPDSRALITLGLGPSKDHLLNPESAMTTVPDPPKSNAPVPSSHPTAATSNPPTPVSSPPATTSTPEDPQ